VVLDANQVGLILINGAIFGSILALIAVGLSLIFGVLGVPNFAQGEFATLSGFTVVWLTTAGLGLLSSIFVGVVVAALGGILIERLVIARFYGREEFLLLTFFATFGITIISENLLRRVFGGFRQIQGPELGTVPVVGINLSVLRILTGLIAVALLVSLLLFTRYTYTGLAMRAVADDHQGAEITGIDHNRIYLVTFAIGGGMTGISGILYGMSFTLYPTLGVLLTLFAFTIVVVGGVGSFYGTILASFLIGLVDSFTATVVGSLWRFFAIFLVLFVVLVLRPEGIRGEGV